MTAGNLAGTGTISANGGNGASGISGGGGGGRIAVYCDTNTYTETMFVNGGAGYEAGGMGTVYLEIAYAIRTTVDDDGPADFSSIQEAIDNTAYGNIVEVLPGTYSENINFTGKPITVRAVRVGYELADLVEFADYWLLEVNDSDMERFDLAASGKIDIGDFSFLATRWYLNGDVIIDGNSLDVVTFNSGEGRTSILEGFTIRNGYNGISCSGSSPTIRNCVIVDNPNYGVECQSSSSPVIANCTIANNGLRGVSATSGSPEITNSILWNNTDDLYNCSATFSCVSNGDPGVGNIVYEPYFVNADEGDYHLNSYSSSIDAGDPGSNSPSESGRINMGAYGGTSEAASSSPDVDGDGLPDDWELSWWPGDVTLSHDPNDNPDDDHFILAADYLFGYNPNETTDEPIEVAYVNASPSQIDPVEGEALTIEYVLNVEADVTSSIINSISSLEVCQNVGPGTVGSNYFVWEGIDDSNSIVENGFYDIRIVAVRDPNVATWTSEGAVNTSPTVTNSAFDTSIFDPYKNIPTQIDFDFTDWGTLVLRINCYNSPDHYLLNNKLLEPGRHTYYWNGRDGDGDIIPGSFRIFYDSVQGIHTGPILVKAVRPEIANIFCNQYRIVPTFREISTIWYDVSQDANVTITITDPDGSHFRTLLNPTSQAAGSYEIVWDGTDDNGNLISTEGVYGVEFTAVHPLHAEISSTNVGAITAYK